MPRWFRQLVGLAAALLKSSLRYRTMLVQLPIVALIPVYFALVYRLSTAELIQVLAGGVVSTGVWVATGVMQDVAYEREVYRFLEMLIASPMKPHVFLLAHVVASYLDAGLSTIPLIALYAWASGSPLSPLWALAISALLTFTLAPLSGVIGLRMRSVKEVGALPSFISTLLVFIPPVYYPASRLPEPLSYASLAIPTVAAAEAFRGLTLGSSLIDPLILLGYLALLSVAATGAAARLLDWRLD